jgi:hypothetical protein
MQFPRGNLNRQLISDIAPDLALDLANIDRGDIVLSGAAGTLDEAEVRRLSVCPKP